MENTTKEWWTNKYLEEIKKEEDESMDGTITICVVIAWIVVLYNAVVGF